MGLFVQIHKLKAQIFQKNYDHEACHRQMNSEWKLGDLLWTKISGHPWWPCIVTNDPKEKVFTKVISCEYYVMQALVAQHTCDINITK